MLINTAKVHSTPVYIATNLMETMIENSMPTRAEVNDIIQTLRSGAKGLVLAAETAIGKYPIECVRMMDRIINEYQRYNDQKFSTKTVTDYLLTPSFDRIIPPHGGRLIQNHVNSVNEKELNELFSLTVNEKIVENIVFPIFEMLNS